MLSERQPTRVSRAKERARIRIRKVSDLHPSAVGLLAATALGNVTNLIYHLLMARTLGPADYGALGAIVAVLAIVTVPVAAIQAALTRLVATDRSSYSDLTESSMNRNLHGVVLVVVLLGTALSAPFATFLGLDSVLELVVLTLFVPFNFLAAHARALLLGRERHSGVAISIASGVIVKLIVGIGFVMVGFGLLGAVLGIVIGEAVTMFVAIARARKTEPSDGRRGQSTPLRLERNEGVEAIFAFVAVWGLVSVDVVFARHRLPPVAAGEYAAAATLARGALFLPAALAMTAIPRFSGSQREAALRTFRKVTILSGTVGLAVVGTLVLVPETAIGMVIGGGYTLSRPLLALLGTAAALVSVVNIAVHFLLARRIRGAATVPWVGLVVATIGLNVAAPSSLFLAIVMVGAAAAVVLMCLVRIGSHDQTEPGDDHQTPLERDQEVELSVVVPMYNPGPEVAVHMARLLSALDQTNQSYEVIAVSDGCTDGSDLLVEALGRREVTVLRIETNQGKGAAVRHGVLGSTGRFVGFIDADGDLDPGSWAAFLKVMMRGDVDIAIGSKWHPDSDVTYPFLRRIASFGFRNLVKVLFGLSVHETQTGFKVMSHEVATAVLPLGREPGFAFDVELLAHANRVGMGRFVELPVRLRQGSISTVSPRTALEMLMAVIRIRIRLSSLPLHETPGVPTRSVSGTLAEVM